MQFHSTFSCTDRLVLDMKTKTSWVIFTEKVTVVTTLFLTTVVEAHSFDEAAPGSIIYIPAHLIL